MQRGGHTCLGLVLARLTMNKFTYLYGVSNFPETPDATLITSAWTADTSWLSLPCQHGL